MGILFIALGRAGNSAITLGKRYGESKNYCRREGFGTYLLSEDRTVSVNETNIVLITEGTVSMESADCPDQICVHHQRIKRSGESIICLPNKVVVSIEGGGEEKLDGTVQ